MHSADGNSRTVLCNLSSVRSCRPPSVEVCPDGSRRQKLVFSSEVVDSVEEMQGPLDGLEQRVAEYESSLQKLDERTRELHENFETVDERTRLLM